MQGNNLWMPQAGQLPDSIRIMKIWPMPWEWNWRAGASALSSAISITMDSRICTSGKRQRVARSGTAATGTTIRRVAGGNRSIISDAANWPPLKGRSLSGLPAEEVLMNDGSGQFKEVAQVGWRH